MAGVVGLITCKHDRGTEGGVAGRCGASLPDHSLPLVALGGLFSDVTVTVGWVGPSGGRG